MPERKVEIPGGEPPPWHALSPGRAAAVHDAGLEGLTGARARRRLEVVGPNRIAPPPPPSRLWMFVRQFKSPLIYILAAAAVLSLLMGEAPEAAFIGAVLVLNAIIGFVNEFRAEREVRALSGLVRTRARVRRDGSAVDVDGEEVVPGDVLLLESGTRVSADIRLIEAHGLRVDESILTGESVPVEKRAEADLLPDTPLAERENLAFAGTMVTSGRATGTVVATGSGTEVGRIAEQLAGGDPQPAPLIVRMERFARTMGWAALTIGGLLVAIGLVRRQPVQELLLGAVALAVSAVPEGLPIALTVALSVAVARMARRKVVVRHLPAVEALGSCSVIATDKTGTLTRNELTVERVVLTDRAYRATGTGYAPEGEVVTDEGAVTIAEHRGLFRALRAGCLANEGSLTRAPDDPTNWSWSGDPTDVALLALAVKAGIQPLQVADSHPTVDSIPFEAERRFSASFHGGERPLTCVKGAPERVLDMCTTQYEPGSDAEGPLDRERILARVRELTREGYRILAVAEGRPESPHDARAVPTAPSNLTYLGLFAMTDPPREAVAGAVRTARAAGISVVMVTGDHPDTARAIAERIGLADAGTDVLLGREIEALSDEDLAERIDRYPIVARATPADKLRVVRAWQEREAFVAVTGDGVNDAPALQQANLGVAMGRSGTDVAREAAELVLTDDDFSSIVAGVEEGRVAYDNVRKVTYLLVSTGAGEVLLVTAAMAAGLPVPFTAAQLLWLNLVTNGIQDVALAFEPGEPGVLQRSPRPFHQRIFDRLMIERTLVASVVFASVGFAGWLWWSSSGMSTPEMRSLLVQLFVLFEVFHIGNSRSERTSIFQLSPFSNRVLFVGTLTALGVHVAALYTPFFQRLLSIQPPSLPQWGAMAVMASSVLVVMEAHKWWWRRRERGRINPPWGRSPHP